MKHQKNRLQICSIICIASLSFSMLAGFFIWQYRENARYQFPVQSGAQAGQASRNPQQMIQDYTIPDEALQKLSTGALIETVLYCPLMGEFFAYSSTQSGFEAVKRKFNGLQELLKRKDCAKQLLKKYRRTQALKQPEQVDATQFEVFYRLSFLEVLLAQPEVQQQAGEKLQEKIEREVAEKQKQKSEMIYGGASDVYHVVLEEIEQREQ